ncbi:double-strand break repair protein AddB [Magnetospirillum molischianum]|uniref:Inactivated superfamily I helicase n=1 Tax=Magnetospirillum molischianum DSM 120 TaxID=1150626 RepID=H8FW77_MAGML|nr:double-strand break repair protein AddB [Magnetospirillum molischianum]CCG42615.1 Inactivated superfamily I helicase [Magnetospirillum molischianum DSM 120]
MTAVFTLPPGLPFVESLAAHLLAEAGDNPMVLAGMEVLLPTRRACRALADAFLRLTGGRPLLLPRLTPLGDLDSDEPDPAGTAEVAPALPALERRLTLTRLVLAMEAGRGGQTPLPDQALRLASELARLLDEIGAERLDPAGLAALVPDEHAAHWQVTLNFLSILTQVWPSILAERGAIEPSERLNQIVAARIAAWTRSPPTHPVIAAGSTGSRPAIADLLAAITALPNGRVILPGLDTDIDDSSWAALDPGHPQYGFKAVLTRIGIERREVKPLLPTPDPRVDRMRLLTEALRPAATCEAWRDLIPLPPETLAGVTRLDAPGPREEAGAIALMLREALDVAGRTAALITPDRALARRVGDELERWGIRIDDSAGRPLNLTEPGAFLRLSARMAAEDFAPIEMLACLKHPLAAGGRSPAAFRALVRRLEIAVLHGPRPATGTAGLRDALKNKDPALTALVDDLEILAGPFVTLLAAPEATLADIARVHLEFAEALATADGQPGPIRLWGGEIGEAAARFAAELNEAAPALGTIAGRHYPALLEEMMAGAVVRSTWETHPRLHIWGPLEARLQQADILILGGLNEGTWPGAAEADPWMSRPMRAAFGLPPPERRIGLAAHDFTQGFAAPRVVLTRARRVEGTPTVPSRWLTRLEAVMTACGLSFVEDTTQWLEWHDLLDRPGQWVRPTPPAPRPPVTARPRRLSVTEIETWMRDPYAIYAKRILKLTALDPIDADASAAEYGSMVHLVLERFVNAFPHRLPPDPTAELIAIGRAVFAEAVASPSVWAFWWPRFVAIAGWVAEREAERRPELESIHAEVRGELEIDAPAGPFTLIAKADRIDRRKDGALELIDYKTGQPPTIREVAAGYAPQLPLEAAIAHRGGFAGIPAAETARLLYWRLKGGEPGGEERPAGADAATLADEALDGLRALIAVFDDPNTPYAARPHPEHAPKYSDYLHLARVREWASGSEDDGE